MVITLTSDIDIGRLARLRHAARVRASVQFVRLCDDEFVFLVQHFVAALQLGVFADSISIARPVQNNGNLLLLNHIQSP